MKLFSTKEEKSLKQLLASVDDQNEVLSLASLHGFLYCLAILPEPVAPGEWLPCVFGEAMLEIEDEKEASSLMAGLFAAYNRLVNASENDNLTFPYDIVRLKADDIQQVRDWAYGFHLGIFLRPEIWGLPGEDEDIAEDEEFVTEEEEEIAACLTVVISVAFPEKIPELFEGEGVETDEKAIREHQARSFSLLPQVVEALQMIAAELHDSQSTRCHPQVPAPPSVRRAEKIGRNDPCPCGSGRKYKKCCGLH